MTRKLATIAAGALLSFPLMSAPAHAATTLDTGNIVVQNPLGVVFVGVANWASPNCAATFNAYYRRYPRVGRPGPWHGGDPIILASYSNAYSSAVQLLTLRSSLRFQVRLQIHALCRPTSQRIFAIWKGDIPVG